MYRVLAGLTLAALLLARAQADDKNVDLKVGDPAPVFQSTDERGKPWKSQDHVGMKFVVVYFYPGDFTPGCMKQAQNFRDGMHELVKKGVEVIGVSGDSAKTHEMFKKDQKLNFTLLSDEKGELAGKFGVPVGKGGKAKGKDLQGNPITVERAATIQRWTFVIDRDGKIVYKNTKVSPALDAKQVTDVIEKLRNK
jgi:thioredoxin-dependent peroxiredoxin